MQKRFCCIFLCLFLLIQTLVLPTAALDIPDASAAFSDLDARSVILMEASTGRVLFEKNADAALPPASVTKVMTILLTLEAIGDGTIALDDTVRISDYASTMGGSQVYLKAGEEMSVDDLLKCVVVASANDAAVALAEHICGSESAFVARMNERAAALGMQNTTFKNTNGLDDEDTGHLTSARDIALMSREVLRHKTIFDYTTIWTDSIRDGAFGLTNTNRLVRFYRGCTGLKTGSTTKAGFCISATAERDGMHLICVIMGSSTKDARNSLAASLLDWGFSAWSVVTHPAADGPTLPVRGGTKDSCATACAPLTVLLSKKDAAKVEEGTVYKDFLSAPVTVGDVVGQITYSVDGEVIGTSDITVTEDIGRIGYAELLSRMLASFAFSASPDTNAD